MTTDYTNRNDDTLGCKELLLSSTVAPSQVGKILNHLQRALIRVIRVIRG